MLRNVMKKNGLAEVRTSNGGKLTSDNARTKDSIRAQRVFMGSTVTAVTTTGRTYETTKGKLAKEALKKDLHRLIDKI